MAKSFDATTKDLLEADPVAWMAYLGLHPQGTVEVIDSDLSTVTAEADKVFRVDGPESYLVHVEMQSSADATLPRRLLRYNVLLDYRHDMRVWSVAVLLRPEAEASTLTGNLDLRLSDGQKVHDFGYGVVRAWRHGSRTIHPAGPMGHKLPHRVPSLRGDMAVGGEFLYNGAWLGGRPLVSRAGCDPMTPWS